MVNTLFSIMYSFLRFKFGARRAFEDNLTQNSDPLVIMMNGPTLYEDIQRLEQTSAAYEFSRVAVANHFANTELFEVYRPRYYFLSDPYFWSDDADGTLKAKRSETFKIINEKTTWKMSIFFPADIDSKIFQSIFCKNDKISLKPFNARGLPVEYSPLIHAIWRFNIGAPYGQNVIAHALFGGIQMRFKKILLLGAGFSFIEQIHIDQETNVFSKQRRHVYGTNLEIAYTDHKRDEIADVTSELLAIYKAFRTLKSVSVYAEKRGCEVINFSEYSYLDMFKRPVKNISDEQR